jgi:hypothetical protein
MEERQRGKVGRGRQAARVAPGVALTDHKGALKNYKKVLTFAFIFFDDFT